MGFSILEQANKGVISDFEKTSDGKDVDFKQSYGASGDQSPRRDRRPEGRPACTSPWSRDVQKLVDAKLVASDWKDNANKGIVTQSVVVIVVRKGNPKGIKTWDDLVKPGVEDRHARTRPRPARRGGTSSRPTATCSPTAAPRPTPTAYLKKFFEQRRCAAGQRS